MIRAGRPVLTAEEVAKANGYESTAEARAAGLFDDPSLPAPVNEHGKRGYKMLWDEQQVIAFAAGRPIPELPTDAHPDDLLDKVEASEYWGVKVQTWESYRQRQPHLIPPAHIEYNIRHWRRGDLDTHPRPGKGAGAGRTKGSTDQRARVRQDKAARLEQVINLLQAARKTSSELSAKDVANTLGISASYARALLSEAAPMAGDRTASAAKSASQPEADGK